MCPSLSLLIYNCEETFSWLEEIILYTLLHTLAEYVCYPMFWSLYCDSLQWQVSIEYDYNCVTMWLCYHEMNEEVERKHNGEKEKGRNKEEERVERDENEMKKQRMMKIKYESKKERKVHVFLIILYHNY